MSTEHGFAFQCTCKQMGAGIVDSSSWKDRWTCVSCGRVWKVELVLGPNKKE